MRPASLFVGIGLLLLGVAPPLRAQLCGPKVTQTVVRTGGVTLLEAAPRADEAVVYVLGPSSGYAKNKVSADGRWIGITVRDDYFVASLPPGIHDFCVQSGNRAYHLKLNLEVQHRYVLRQGLQATLSEAPPDTLADALKKRRRNDFAEKTPETESAGVWRFLDSFFHLGE